MKTTLKDLIPIDTRISMLQTCFNVAGSNFQSRKVTPKILQAYAFELYVGMMKQIKATERNTILAVTRSADQTTKKISRKSTQKLLTKVSKK